MSGTKGPVKTDTKEPLKTDTKEPLKTDIEDEDEESDPLYHSDQESDNELCDSDTPDKLLTYIVHTIIPDDDDYKDYKLSKIEDWKQVSNKMVTTCLFNVGYANRKTSEETALSTDNCKVFKVLAGNWKVYYGDNNFTPIIFMVHEKFNWNQAPIINQRSLQFDSIVDSCSGDIFDKARLPIFTNKGDDNDSGYEGQMITLDTGGDTGYQLYTHNTKDGSDLVIIH
jgi:hypothetical protein